jgi:hypothetical protein
MTASDLPRFTQNASTEPSEAPQGLLALSAQTQTEPALARPGPRQAVFSVRQCEGGRHPSNHAIPVFHRVISRLSSLACGRDTPRR